MHVNTPTPTGRDRADSALGNDTQSLVENVVDDILAVSGSDAESSEQARQDSSEEPTPLPPPRRRRSPPLDVHLIKETVVDPSSESDTPLPPPRARRTGSNGSNQPTGSGPGPGPGIGLKFDSSDEDPLEVGGPTLQGEEAGSVKQAWRGSVFAAADQEPGLVGAPPQSDHGSSTVPATRERNGPFNASLDVSRIPNVDSPMGGTPAALRQQQAQDVCNKPGDEMSSGSLLDISDSSGDRASTADGPVGLPGNNDTTLPRAVDLDATLEASTPAGLGLEMSEDDLGLQMSSSGASHRRRSHSGTHSHVSSHSRSRSRSRSYSRSGSVHRSRSRSRSSDYSHSPDGSRSSGQSRSSRPHSRSVSGSGSYESSDDDSTGTDVSAEAAAAAEDLFRAF